MNLTNIITHAIIANQIALNHNEAIKHTPYYKRGLKQRINQLLPELIKTEKDYDEFFNKIEDSTSEVYAVYDGFLKAVASVPIWECKNLTMVIEAYNKNLKAEPEKLIE